MGSVRPGVNEDDLIGAHLANGGYTTVITGKTDWVSGDHSLTTMVDSWTIYARFPYSQPEQGGFHIWGDCGGECCCMVLLVLLIRSCDYKNQLQEE